ncbi:hypothetical protein MMC18_009488 [Xylographa bjoerkii]|nr:hypothetical protein [Xylographa bjoerkii]
MQAKASARRVSCSRSSISSVTSDSTARHSFPVLLESPPSPRLPSLLPYHGKKPSSYRFRRSSHYFIKALSGIAAIGLLVWFISTTNQFDRARFDISYLTYNGERHELIGDNYLPKEPMPVALTDHNGRTRWTVYIPENQDVPLTPSVYADLCSQSEDMAAHVAEMAGYGTLHIHKHGSDYYHVDKNFMDVKEAEGHGLLTGRKAKPQTRSWKSSDPITNTTSTEDILNTTEDAKSPEVCERSLTYVLESSDAGFGHTLLGLWLAYGLAVHEKRAFFIDDSHWYGPPSSPKIQLTTDLRAYGTYTTFFRPPPLPLCLSPPPHHKFPYPHSARHLLVSAATHPWTFGAAFTSHFSSPHKPSPLRQKHIFALLRTGHDALFHLASPDADYLSQRLSLLSNQRRSAGGPLIGIHVRHGDRHPWEAQYRESYLPLERYADAAHALATQLPTPGNASAAQPTDATPRVLLASDDPEVYSSPVFATALRAQEQILLASKTSFPAPQQPLQPIHKFVDESAGWEGGFYKDVFWGLGRAAKTARRGVGRERPGELALQLRGLLGRSYLLDLAVLGRADAVVCAASSVACRVLGVMVGWEGVVGIRWGDVDGDGAEGWVGLV